jgi:hypothetical protein
MTINIRIHFEDGKTTIDYVSKSKSFKSFSKKFFKKKIFMINYEDKSVTISTTKVLFLEQI